MPGINAIFRFHTTFRRSPSVWMVIKSAFVTVATCFRPASRVLGFSATSPGGENLKPQESSRLMKIAIIGSGRIGSTVGKLWAKAGHDVRFSSRHAAHRNGLEMIRVPESQGVMTAAPSIESFFKASRASLASSSGNVVTFGRRPISLAS
jgi:hypothetical protein